MCFGLPSLQNLVDAVCVCCSPDHLHLFVTAPNPKSFEDAKGLAVNLIDTVRAEHAKLYAVPTIPQQPAAVPAQSQTPMQSMPQHSQVPMPMPMHSHAHMQTQQQQAQVQMPMHSQAPSGQQQAPVQQHGPGQGPAMAGSSSTRPGGPQWQQPQGIDGIWAYAAYLSAVAHITLHDLLDVLHAQIIIMCCYVKHHIEEPSSYNTAIPLIALFWLCQQ